MLVSWFKSNRELQIIHGKIGVGRSTKKLLRTLEPKRIVVIKHVDLDEIAAHDLIQAKVNAVINADVTMTGNYPIKGPSMLLQAGIPILEIEEKDFEFFESDMEITIDPPYICTGGERILFTIFDEAEWQKKSATAHQNLNIQLNQFIDNTLLYAGQEKDFVTNPLPLPKLDTDLMNKHVVVVVRGCGYKNDLLAIKDYIEDYHPVLIGVDGGADALIESGMQPQMIIGDMDSISDEALKSDAEIIVHAYPDGRAPGMERIHGLGLKAKQVAAKGTSEDLAMLIAYEKNAELIVTLGTHTHMIDFLEKGRKGMASTMLVRMKIGSKLIDAKGVSKLYHRKVNWRQLWYIPAAGMFPLFMLVLIHPGLKQFVDMLWLYMKLVVTSNA